MRLTLATVFAMYCGLCAAQDAGGARGAAFTFAKKIVLPSLNNPASADFSWESVTVEWAKKTRDTPADEPYEIVKVSGVVRATNSFNATVAQNWGVLMTYKKEVWEPAVVTLGDDVVFASQKGKMLLENAREKKEQRLREEDEKRRNRDRQEKRLQEAKDAGVAAADAAIRRNKWNSRVADANIARAAKKALEGSGFDGDKEESGRFTEAFVDHVRGAKAKTSQ